MSLAKDSPLPVLCPFVGSARAGRFSVSAVCMPEKPLALLLATGVPIHVLPGWFNVVPVRGIEARECDCTNIGRQQ